MKNKLFLLFTLLAVAVGCTKPDDNQDNPTPPAPSEESLVISVDNESIYADGLEVATFTVEYTIDGETTDVTSEVTILEDKAGAIKGNTFSTTVAGTYKFYTSYGMVNSNVVEVLAQEVPEDEEYITLTVDKNEIQADANDVATMTVTHFLNGEQTDITVESYFYLEDGTYLEAGNVFSTAQPGTYTIYARYESIKSNNITVTATEIETPPTGDLNIGDLYSSNGVVGVVFRVPTEETPGLIISLDEGFTSWSTEYAWVNCVFTKGELNCEMIYRQENWEEKYPAAKWCYDHGEGWFLPSDDELAEFWLAFNGSLTGDNKEQQELFNSKFTTKIEIGSAYWSSNEISEDMATAYQLNDPTNIVICLTSYKYQQYPVKAVRYIY